MIEESEILNLLIQIEKGELSIVPTTNPNEIYAGNVEYKVSNGWEMVIFNDANTWDYLDSIKTKDGRFLDFESLDKMETIRNYYPPDLVIKNLYQIG